MTYLEQMQEFHAQSAETTAIYTALEKQTSNGDVALDHFLQQLDLATATDGLPLWEQAYGLEPDAAKEYQYRRERVMSRMRGQGLPTVAKIKELAETFANGEVEVDEYPAAYRFILRFVSVDGVPPHIADLAEAVEQFKPAHLAFAFAYTYTTHEKLHGYTHDELRVMIHDQIRRPEKDVRNN